MGYDRLLRFSISSIRTPSYAICVVDVDKQRSGYGTQLLTHAIERCARNGIESLALDVRKSNLVAKKLYAGFGFKKVGLRKSYYAAAIGREDAEVMEMRIEKPTQRNTQEL